MKRLINGIEIEIPMNVDGTISAEDLRRCSGIADNRQMILQRPDGTNEFIKPGQDIQIRPTDHIVAAPRTVRG